MTTSKTRGAAKADPKPPKAPTPPKTAAPAAPEVKAAAPEVKTTDPVATSDSEQPQLTRLDQARNLPEVDVDLETEWPGEELTAIESFKGEDRRTMNVVLVDGALAQQEVNHE